MKKLLVLGLVALGAGMTACNQDVLESAAKVKKGNFTITASREDGTKTTVGSSVLWTDQDQIIIYSNQGDSAILSLLSGSGTGTAQFTGSIDNTAASPDRKFFAMCNANIQCPAGAASSYSMIWNRFRFSGALEASKYIVQMNVPENQTQDLSNPAASLGKYTQMLALPVSYEGEITALSNIPFTFHQMTTILDFQLNNIPAGQTVERVALKAATPGDLAFNVRGLCDVSLPDTDPNYLKLVPIGSKTIAEGGNLGASYSDLLFVKTSNVTEGAKVSIVTLPVDFSAAPKDLKIVVSVKSIITGQTTDLIFDKPSVSSNFERGKRYTTTLNLAAPTSTEVVLFRDDFQWMSAPMNYVNFFDNPKLGTELGYSGWAQADKDQGWTSGTTSIYQRSAGYLKLGKTSYGGEIISPALGTKTGLFYTYPSVKVRVRMAGYMSSAGTKDPATYNVTIPSADATLVEASGMPYTFTNFNQLQTFEFHVLNFTPNTLIAFTSGLGLAKINKQNRFFFDDFEIIATSSPSMPD